MNQFRCSANLWLVLLFGFAFACLASTGTSVNGDEPKPDAKQTKLEQWLKHMSSEEMLSIAGDSAMPETISELYDSREQLNSGLVREFARRLEVTKTNSAKTQQRNGVATSGSGAMAVEKVAFEDKFVPVEIRIKNVDGEAFHGQPFSTGSLQVEFESGHGPIVFPDHHLFLDAIDQRVHYATFDITYQGKDGEAKWMVDRIRINFLIRGADPCQVSLSSVSGVLLDGKDIEMSQNDVRHRELLRQWWSQFSVVPASYGPEQRELKETILDILSRRLQLPGPWPSVTQSDDAANESSLEHQFERGIGMLFGIESVTLAMQAEATLSESGRVEKADQPLPPLRPFESVAIQPAPHDTWIEPIAKHVPAECFYLRTGGLANYRQFRQFLLGWGGDLNDIVSNGAMDHRSRERIEGQLGISPDSIRAETFDPLITDMALIGLDPMFDDGAAVGILFQATESVKLAEVIKEHRHQASLRVPNSEVKRVSIEGHDVSFITSNDNRIRSFYTIKDNYHLVTNSQHLVSRFIQASQGINSLGALNEFRHARSQTSQIIKRRLNQEPLAMLYLSDPFFQHLISPGFRIELTRRHQAENELRQFQLALMMAKSERLDATTIDRLIELKYFPPRFGTRPDASYLILERGNLRDSLRGAMGYFTPIADVPPQQATRTEVIAYQQFIVEYSQKWRKIDPVTVVFSSDQPDGNGIFRVGLDIVITPYAQQHYATLREHLATAGGQRVAPMRNDLVSLDTSIRLEHDSFSSHRLYLGLRDDDVPFMLKHGEIELLNEARGTSYAKNNSYAAISPPSNEMLKFLASVFNRVQREHDVRKVAVAPLPPAPRPPANGVGPFGLLGFLIAGVVVNNNHNLLKDTLQHLLPVASNYEWTVASLNQSLREEALQEIATEWVNDAPQVRLRVGSLSNSKVEPYIQAYTYLASRRTSYENSRFLNDATEWLQLPIEESRQSIETVLGTQLRCPLGGDFQLNHGDGHSCWTGTRWPTASLFTETTTPASWKFSFLDWLRGLELQFNLEQTTLRANINLKIYQPADRKGSTKWKPLVVNATSASHGKLAAQQHIARDQVSSFAKPLWILGVQVRGGNPWFEIASIYPESPASRFGLLAGDRILSVNQVTPYSRVHLSELVASARDQTGTASLRLLRKGSEFTSHIVFRK